MSDVVHVTARQVWAARIRVAGDRRLHRRTPDWIVRLARVVLP